MSLIRILVAALMAFSFSSGAVRANTALDFAVDITAAVEPVFPGEGAGYAGVGFDGTHFWVAKWASDRITRIATDGSYFDSFTIPGLSGTRSLSWDGSHFWVANNTTTLYRVDPATRTVVATINTSIPDPTRFASYDPNADGGNGGFWIGNFNTDIVRINMAGNELSRLSAANLTQISGRYAVVLDTISTIQPILWAFSQSGTSSVELTPIDMITGQLLAQPQSLANFLPDGTSPLAGGLYFANGSQPGMPSMLAVTQGTPSNFILGLDFLEFSIFEDSFDVIPVP